MFHPVQVQCSSLAVRTCCRLVEACSRDECNVNNTRLAAAGYRCILYDWFWYGPVHGVPLNHESMTGHVLIFVFQGVNLVNMVNMKALPLDVLQVETEDKVDT